MNDENCWLAMTGRLKYPNWDKGHTYCTLHDLIKQEVYGLYHYCYVVLLLLHWHAPKQ